MGQENSDGFEGLARLRGQFYIDISMAVQRGFTERVDREYGGPGKGEAEYKRYMQDLEDLC